MKRYAIVRNARSRREAEAYLPDNYKVIAEYESVANEDGPTARVGGETRFVIAGEDVAGWTLDDYVIPRYASGLITATEVDESHPVMTGLVNAVVKKGLLNG